MNQRPNQELTPDERRAREAVESLRVPEPEREFRARLRDAFVSGEAPPARRRVLHLPWHRRPMTHWTLAVAAAAAAFVAVITLNGGGEWHVISVHGASGVLIDGRGVPGGDVVALERRLHAGARVELPAGSDLTLSAGNQWLMAIERGTSLTLPAIPGRWFQRETQGMVDAGEIRVSTTPSFHGATLALATPEAEVRVTGTTFAVICEPAGTCVCVLEGTVRVGGHAGGTAPVPAGMRAYAFADGRPMMRTTMRPDEVPALGALRERRRSLLEPPAR